MPNSTVTVRPLKNKLSGIDINIVSVTENPGILTTVVEYTVVVVSNLQCFKLPQHKDTDVVQFAIVKTYEDFERLRQKLCSTLPHTVFPQLPKSPISSLFETNAAAKRTAVDEFVKLIASEPHLATCHVTLEFLGVNPLTAGKFTHGGNKSVAVQSSKSDSSENAAGLFDSTTADSDDLFGNPPDSDQADEDLFKLTSDLTPGTTACRSVEFEARLFDGPNLDADGITNDEEKLFLVPAGARVDKHLTLDFEDVSSLLTIDDDFDKLFKTPSESHRQISSGETDVRKSTSLDDKSQKPVLKPKPQVPAKGSALSSKPVLPPKPAVNRAKPSVPINKSEDTTASKGSTAAAKSISDVNLLNIQDIAKYIEENSQEQDSETDLFT